MKLNFHSYIFEWKLQSHFHPLFARSAPNESEAQVGW